MIILEKLNSILTNLNSLDILIAKKFISNEFNNLNEILKVNLSEFNLINGDIKSSNFSQEEQNLILAIVTKIDNLETKVLPKANLIKAFSENVK